MPYLLEDLEINRVDLVDEGANSAAFIELYKRKERSDIMELSEILKSMTPEHAAVVQAEIDRLSGDVTKMKQDMADMSTQHETDRKEMEGKLTAANEDCKKAQDELETLKAAATPFDEEETLKAMPEAARTLFAKMKTKMEVAEENVRKAQEAEAESKAIAKAAELKALPVEQTKLVQLVKGASPELLDVLTSINAAIDGTVLGEVGKKGGDATSSSDAAWAKIEQKATEIAKSTGVSKAKAISEAVNQNPDLYKEYLQGGAN